MDNIPIDISEIVETKDFLCNKLSFCASNQLFRIDVSNASYILKIYRRLTRFERERDMMYLFMKNKCKTPELVKYDKNPSACWLLYKYINGICLQKSVSVLSAEELMNIFEHTGKALNKIHTIRLFNEIEKRKKMDDYMILLKKRTENNIKNIHLNNEILCKAILFLRNNYSTLSNSFCGIILYDFNDKHIIIEKKKNKWKLNALIDFEEAFWGNIYTDTVGLYIYHLLDNRQYEESFWKGYGINTNNNQIHDRQIIFFLLQYAIEMCAMNQFNFGISIIKKTFSRYNL
jgi:aminoglycoside phosphotransferase (APT) family kinase protein